MDVGKVLMTRFSALCVVLATAAFVVGFATPWWLQAPSLDGKAGLWRNCVGDHCTSIVSMDSGDWLIACQALSITALLTSLLTLGLVVIMMRASRDSTSNNARYGVIATSLLTGTTIAVTLLIYFLQNHILYPDDFYAISFSFFFVLVGDGLFLAVALMLAIFSVTAKLCHSDPSPS